MSNRNVVSVEWDDQAQRELFTSVGWRRTLDRICFTIVGHAIPHVGVDTGALVNSLGHAVEEARGEGGVFLEGIMGSGTADGVEPIVYAAPHMAGRRDPDGRRAPKGRRRKSRPHTTKSAPTKPFSKALTALGITYKIERFES
jgi:hypothetical protein